MATSVQPFPNDCYHLFLEPFNQGTCNIRDAIGGTRIQNVVTGATSASTPIPKRLDLSERITAFVIGALLLVPFVNAVAMLILKRISSNYLYPPVNPGSDGIELPASSSSSSSSSTLTEPLPVVITEPLPTPEELMPRKTAALARLSQIEGMGNTPNQAFAVNPGLLTFDLGAVLQRYPAVQQPSVLLNFLGWAEVEAGKRGAFQAAVMRYNNLFGSPQQLMARTLLSHMSAYFTQKRALVSSGTQEETDLKEQFRGIVDRMIDANQNCVDQVLSQLEQMMLDVIAEGSPEAAGNRAVGRLFYRAGQELCKYRSVLVREICARENPRERHMPTLERLVKQRLGAALGMGGAVFETGAQYAHMLRDYEGGSPSSRAPRIEADIQRTMNTFLNEYRPLEYLTNNLRSNLGNARKLRSELSVWADRHYGISREDAEAADTTATTVPAALNMDRRLAAHPDDDYGTFSMGGHWTPAATLWLLEAANLVLPQGNGAASGSSSRGPLR